MITLRDVLIAGSGVFVMLLLFGIGEIARLRRERRERRRVLDMETVWIRGHDGHKYVWHGDQWVRKDR